MASVQSYWEAGQQMPEAMRLFDIQWNSHHPAGSSGHIADPRHFISYNVRKLEQEFTLHDLSGQSHAPKMPDEVVRQCAGILGHGYEQQLWVQVGGNWHQFWEPRHYTSIRQACELSAELGGYLDDYDVTPKYLLRRMHEVVPDLVYSALPMKMELSHVNKLARAQYAGWMYQLHLADPNFLKRVVFGDETRIYVGKDLMGKLFVYHFRHDTEGRVPLSNPLLDHHNTLRVDVLLFVSAQHGLEWVEWLTGTTGLETTGRHNAGMQQIWARRMADGRGRYKVSQ